MIPKITNIDKTESTKILKSVGTTSKPNCGKNKIKREPIATHKP
jgi:hypothetical protein